MVIGALFSQHHVVFVVAVIIGQNVGVTLGFVSVNKREKFVI